MNAISTPKAIPLELAELCTNCLSSNESGLFLVASANQNQTLNIMNNMNSHRVFTTQFSSDNALFQQAHQDKKSLSEAMFHSGLFLNTSKDISDFFREIAIYKWVSKPVIFLSESSHNHSLSIIQSIVSKGFKVVCAVNSPSVTDAVFSLLSGVDLKSKQHCDSMIDLSNMLIGIVMHTTVLTHNSFSSHYELKVNNPAEFQAIFEVKLLPNKYVGVNFTAPTYNFNNKQSN